MKLKRPEISDGKWVQNVDTIWRGDRFSHEIVCHPINNKRSIADATAISSLPEVMDFLEAMRAWAQYMGGWEWEDDLEKLLLKLGYTQEEELPTPTPKPDSET